MTAPLTLDELDNLSEGKASNPHWWKVIIAAAGVQAERRRKYSGEDYDEQDPYTNFIIMAQVMGVSVQEVFPWYITIKLARLLVDNEAADDALFDSEVDGANYFGLGGGWRKRSPADKIGAMLNRGVWVDATVLEEAIGMSVEELLETARKKSFLPRRNMMF